MVEQRERESLMTHLPFTCTLVAIVMSKDEREVIKAVIVSTAIINAIAMHHARLFVVCTSALSWASVPLICLVLSAVLQKFRLQAGTLPARARVCRF